MHHHHLITTTSTPPPHPHRHHIHTIISDPPSLSRHHHHPTGVTTAAISTDATPQPPPPSSPCTTTISQPPPKVDTYTEVKEQRIKWTRNNQDTLHIELYHNLCDAVTRGDTSAAGLGKRIVLPRTFTGSPRYMMHNYQDAMALCQAYGNPDLFIAFTSNPKWPEIAEMLAYFPGQKAHDRAEVGTRVFKLKLTELLDDLTKKHVFGQSEADDPAGYKVVTEYMLHSPCGKDARYAACTNDDKCSKHFPKSFLAETFLDEEGYPHYCRRDNKVIIKKGKFTYDNKHVVPHNHYLLLKYNALINVEWCNRLKAIKYLFKYLNKGPDRATIVIQENVKNGNTLTTEHVSEVDKIKNYLNCHFLAPCEAVWRLFSFDIHYSYPTVMQLSFHLPNQNTITLRDSENLPALLQREGIDVTMFTDWFELNKHGPAARTHTYADIPKHYVWHEKKKLWLPRKQRKCIGRIVYSSPASGERYYLRMLLNVVREWTKALSEASMWALGPQLRDIFITMLLLCDVAVPLKLWETNWQALSEDIIQELLRRFGRSLTDFKDLPQPNPNFLTNMDNRLIQEALDFDIKKAGLRLERRIVFAVASSGIASLLLPAGRTAHSRFVIPLELKENSTCGIKQNTQLVELMQEVHLMIWDEAPMTQRYAFEALDITLRDILGSELWNYCMVFTLTRSMMVNEYCANGEIDTSKQEFNRWVLAVGGGTLPAKMKDGENEPTWIDIPEKFLIKT
ncbi:uncharacterized protein Tco_0458180 [Tanacetum coccineum]